MCVSENCPKKCHVLFKWPLTSGCASESMCVYFYKCLNACLFRVYLRCDCVFLIEGEWCVRAYFIVCV